MPDAAYYRMKAKECFDHALSAANKAEAERWRERGREYGELAIAVDAETGRGATAPAHLATEGGARNEQSDDRPIMLKWMNGRR
jgi:hypothetical protein